MGTANMVKAGTVEFGRMTLLEKSRWRFLQLAGNAAIVGLADCTGGNGGAGEKEEELPEGVSEEAFEKGPGPGPYRTI